VSGDRVPVVDLAGTSMVALVRAIPVTAALTGSPVIVVGGLAVLCRLSRPYRTTSDLDTVHRRTGTQTPQLELLVNGGAQASGPSGVRVATPAGPVQVDVLEVSDADLHRPAEDPTDRLHVLSHAWAASTATAMVLRTADGDDLTVRVAEPGALVATKLQSVTNRGREKEGTDLLDIIRLTLDRSSGPAALRALSQADPRLRRDALLHSLRWFEELDSRTLRIVRQVPEGKDVGADDIDLVAELLHRALRVT